MSKRILGLSLLLVLATLAAYAPAVRGGFVWDDDDYVTENGNLRSLHGLERIWFTLGAVPQYYPLVHTTFWLEYHLWSLRPLGFHLTNVLLHAGNALLLWEILRRLRVPGCWLAAALFALHPIQVESVAWVTERKNVLSGLFYLLAALAFLRGRDRIRYALTLVLFLCALLSKSVTATLPAALAVVLWFRDGRVSRRDLVRLAAMLPFGAAAGFLTSWMEKYSVGAAGPDWALTPVDRLIVAGRAFWFYLLKLAWPDPLVFIYPRWKIGAVSPAMLLYPAAAVALLIVLWVGRRRIGRGPLTAALLFAGTLAPALGFVNVYPMRFSFVADHFAYLAVIGPLTILAAAATKPAPRWRTVAASFVLSALFLLTWRRAHAYADEETLWRDTLQKNPEAFIANNNLGGILLLKGELAPAEGYFEASLRSRRDFPEGLDNLGVVRQRQGKPDEAASLFREALRFDPRFVDAHNNLGIVLAEQGKSSEALDQFREAVRLRPSFAKGYQNAGLALEALGRSAEAAAAYRETMRLGNDAANVALRLAWILATDADASVRDGGEAVRLAEAASRASGEVDPHALDVLAAAYAEAGRFDDAVRAAQRALDQAGSSVDPAARRAAEQRLALYREHRAVRS